MTLLRRQGRRCPRRRRARAPRRPRRRHQPAGQGADRARAGRDRRARRPAASRLGGDLGDQRQDDHGRDGRIGARAAMGSGWSTTAPARTWPVASPRRCCRQPGAAGASTASSGCSRSTSSGWTRSCPQLARVRCCSATCSATSSTATASSRRSPTAGPRSWRGLPPTARLVLNADDPLIADLGRDAPERHLLRDRGPVGGDRRDAARLGLQALPQLRRRLRLRGDLPRPPRRYRCPSCGQQRPAPTIAAERIALDGTRSAALQPAHAGRKRRRSSCRCRVSTTSTTRSAPRRCASRSRPAPTGRRRSGTGHGRVRARRATHVGDTELSILLIKNPAGANEVLRTLALEHGELDLLAILNDRTADGRDVSWIWDADFELLAARVAHVTCAGTRAAELALRLKYAGVRWSGCRSSPDLPAALDARARRRAIGAAVRAADLHGAARAARRAGRAATSPLLGAPAGERDLARPRVRRLRRGPAAVARAGRRARRPGARRRRRHRPGRARPRRATGTA